jgi:hypothetical protein
MVLMWKPVAYSFSYVVGSFKLDEWESQVIFRLPFEMHENVKNSIMLVRLHVEGQPY